MKDTSGTTSSPTRRWSRKRWRKCTKSIKLHHLLPMSFFNVFSFIETIDDNVKIGRVLSSTFVVSTSSRH